MNRLKGISMIIIGAMMWGATGPMMEWLLATSDMSISFMLTVRLLIAGFFILLFLKLKGKDIYRPLRHKVWLRQMVIFGLFGMLGVQFTFVGAIDASNAVIATLFQFLAPIYIILFVSVRQRVLPPATQVIGMIVTMVGLYFLLTNGTLSGFALSAGAIAWGLAVGFTFTFYTLYPARLMNEWGVLLSVGWGMLIGGGVLFFTSMTKLQAGIATLGDWRIVLVLSLAILIGTVAF
ncbi:MAG TPA: DMT family transporter, partial [Candidatus Jeotgalibaca pullicola]|nr:DMT family transporter [Candidatus Jeotgalibaca pullicola]